MKKSKQTGDSNCWKCGKPGHFKRDCRVGKGKNDAGTSGGSKGDPKQAGQNLTFNNNSGLNYVSLICE